MKTILIKEGCPNPISLGEKGENGVSAVLFDYSEWISDFGEGAISLLVKRKGDSSAYPVVLDTADGIATWTISDTDTAVQGYGKAEYVFTIDDKVAKSAVFSFFVAQDLGTAGDPPDPYESWIDTLTALGGETLINAQRAEAAQTAAETAQASAETAATNAATSATNAAQSAGAARFAAESALASSDSASASATAASGHATAAEAAKDLAISAAESAQHSETQAELSASAAAESAESASGSAAQAQQSASNAATSALHSANNAAQAIEAASDAEEADRIATQAATSATQSANNASASASAAATSETNAAQSATSAEASAQEAATEAAKLNNYLPVDTASGSIASFPDGASGVPVKALTVALEPVQDLHGQSSPYPAGGGKNKWDGNASFTLSSAGFIVGGGTLAASYRINLPANEYKIILNFTASTTMEARLFKADGTYFTTGGASVINGQNVKTINCTEAIVGIGIYINAAGTASNFMICLSSVTDYTYAPYSNLCPITGHTQAQVWRAGKNLLEGELTTRTVNGTTFTVNSDGSITVSGTPTTQTRVAIKRGLIWNGVASVIFSTGTMPSGTRVFARRVLNGNTTYPTISETANITLGAEYYDFYLEINTTFSGATFTLYPQLELGSTASAYEEYNAVHISIPLGQTVYGGTLDVVGGKCVVDRAMVDLGTLTWSYNTSYGLFYSAGIDTLVKSNGACICDRYAYGNAGDSSADKVVQIGRVGWFNQDVIVKDTSYTDAVTFKTAMSGAQLCYELATPITIDLTDIPTISTLLGTNNIWSDSGDVSATYRADIQKYIAKVIAEALA